MRRSVDPKACRKLWLHVLTTIVRDLLKPHWSSVRRDAESWIGDRPSPDFREVCELAGVEPSVVHAGLNRFRRLPREDRKSEVRVHLRDATEACDAA